MVEAKEQATKNTKTKKGESFDWWTVALQVGSFALTSFVSGAAAAAGTKAFHALAGNMGSTAKDAADVIQIAARRAL